MDDAAAERYSDALADENDLSGLDLGGFGGAGRALVG